MQLLQLATEGSATVLTPTVRRLDASVAPAFKQEAITAVQQGVTGVVLDLAQVEFVDSSGLGAMVSILKALGGKVPMAVCNPGTSVMALFKLTRMDRVFTIAGSRAEAIERLGA